MVVVANNGQEALDLIEKAQFDCALMDVQMPVMDGLKATRHIHGNPRFSHLPVIAMTANASIADKERCLAAGMDHFTTKPIALDTFIGTLAQCLRNREKKRLITETAKSDPAPMRHHGVKHSASNPEVIDLQVLAAIVGDNQAKIRKFALKFIEIAQQSITEMEVAPEQEDLPSLSALGHRTKSAAQSVGAMRFGELSQSLEDIDQNGGLEFARRTVPQLQPLLDLIKEEVEAADEVLL